MPATVREHFGLKPNVDVDGERSLFLAGLECEIESIKVPQNWPGFFVKEDHSLRNYGFEYVSPPDTKENLLRSFKDLHASLAFRKKEEAFSDRTSIHVHVNCRSLDLKQVRNIVLLYALFEEYFFKFTEPSRRHNIHCTPLTETYLPVRYCKPLPYLVDSWSKYTALNIVPLKTLGTIEFRHMHGHSDAALLDEWLSTIENLWELGKTAEINEKLLKDQDVPLAWFGYIFKDSRFVETTVDAVRTTLANSLIDLKLAV